MADVNGDVTPTTGEKIDKVKSNEWQDMSITELYDQLTILNKRHLQAMSCGSIPAANQIQRGIAHLQALISSKEPKETKLL